MLLPSIKDLGRKDLKAKPAEVLPRDFFLARAGKDNGPRFWGKKTIMVLKR